MLLSPDSARDDRQTRVVYCEREIMPPYFESHEDIKVTGLVGGGVGAGRADSVLLSSLDALARTSEDWGNTRDGASSPPPFLKLRPDPDEDVIFSGGAGFSSSSPSPINSPSGATPPPRRSESSPIKSQAATSPLLVRSNSLKRMGSVKRLEVGKRRKRRIPPTASNLCHPAMNYFLY